VSTQRRTGFHPVNIAHLVMGLVLLGLVGIWALVEGDVVGHDDLRWLLPVPWVVAGVAGLTAAAVTGTRRHAVQHSGWAGVSDAPAGPEQPGPAQPPGQSEPLPETEDQEQP
jgi:hypothetical protein